MPNASYKSIVMLPAVALLLVFQVQLVAQPNRVDPYGGYTRVAADATGYFRLALIKGRHMLITPDGHGFFSLGLNHISSIDEVKPGTGQPYSEEARSKKILDDLASWNMNTCGYNCPQYMEEKVPFMLSIRFLSNGHYLPVDKFSFDDVFDEQFMQSCEEKVSEVTRRTKDNPYLIGYYWTDTPRWDIAISNEKHGNNWVSYIRNLPAAAAGKRRYVEFLRSQYQTIDRFNRAYKVHFKSFDALHEARFDHLDFDNMLIKADDQAFLAIIAEHHYSYLHQLFEKYDSNHLIFGEKYIAKDHPDVVLQAAAKYVDVISIQPGPTQGPGPGQGIDERYFDKPLFDHIHQVTGKPIMICDHQTSFYTEEHPVTLWHQSETPQEAVAIHRNYLLSSVQEPYIIGYQRCQYVDSYHAARGLLKQGMLNQQGEAHPELQQGFTKNNQEALNKLFKD